jgi:hypothetical protein
MTLQPGDVVDITIKGVRIADDQQSALALILDEHGDVYAMPPQAAIEHVAPPEWPPLPGDVWREIHADGAIWFAQRYLPEYDDAKDCEGMNAEGWRVVMVPLNGGPYGCPDQRPEALVRKVGLVLVHRETAEVDA